MAPKTLCRALMAASLTATLAASLAGCSANSGVNADAPTASAKAALPTVVMAVSPDTLAVGQSAIATWNTSGATSCVATGAWSGTMPVSNSTGATLGPIPRAGTYTYGLTCTGAGGSNGTSQIITVGSVAAPTITLAIVPAAIKPGDSSTLTWSTTNATSCTASSGTGSDGWNGNQPTSNSTGFNTGRSIPRASMNTI